MEDVAIDPESATGESKLIVDVTNEATTVRYKVCKAQIVCLLCIELQKCSNRQQKGFKTTLVIYSAQVSRYHGTPNERDASI